MLDEVVSAKIAGVRLFLYQSKASNLYYVVYGLDQEKYNTLEEARDRYIICLNHAFELLTTK